MPTTNLTNITIKKLEDKNFKPYYVIVNNDNQEEVYFCFSGAVKSGWSELVSNWENLKEVEIEFEEKRSFVGDQKEQNFKTYRKVVSVYVETGEIIFNLCKQRLKNKLYH